MNVELLPPNFLVPLALFGWIILVPVIFFVLPPRRAVLAAYLLSWMFLPMAGYDLRGLPYYDKSLAASTGALLGVLLFDFGRILTFRPKWYDLPMAAWCVAPFFSSVTNDLGAYDGVSASFAQTTRWLLPYFLGRIYFTDLGALRDLAMAFFIGGLVYVPLCLWEIRMAPMLHVYVYGFFPHVFMQHVRGDSFRPVVFMQHALMVGLWMAQATIAGAALWYSKSISRIGGLPVWPFVILLAVTTLLTRASFAGGMMLVGLAAVLFMLWRRSAIPLVLLVALIPAYIGLRITQVLPRETVVDLVTEVAPEERVHSLNMRMKQEDLFAARAMKQPMFGWGGWERSFPVDPDTGKRATRGVDGFWTIVIGNNGLYGLIVVCTVILLPPLLFLWRVPRQAWRHPMVAPGVAVSLIMVLWMADNLLNAMIIPLLLLAAGGLSGMARVQIQAATQARRAVMPEPALSRRQMAMGLRRARL